MRRALLLVLVCLAVPALSQSVYETERGMYASFSYVPMSYESQLGSDRMLGVKAGVRLGNGLDVSVAVASSKYQRRVGVSPGFQYTAALSRHVGAVVSARAFVTRWDYVGSRPSERDLGALLSASAYVRVPVTSAVETLPQIGVTVGVYDQSDPFAGIGETSDADDYAPSTLSLDVRLPLAAGRGEGALFVVTPGLSVRLLDGADDRLRRVVPTLGAGIAVSF